MLTKNEKIARAIIAFCKANELWSDCRIYWDGKAEDSHTGRIESIDPTDYCEYTRGSRVAMTFEGPLYDVLNGWGKWNWDLQEKFRELLAGFNCYYELGHAWSLGVYDI